MKLIKKFDNLFDSTFREHAYNFACNSFFKIGWGDALSVENRSHQYLHSDYNKTDVDFIGILKKIEQTEVQHYIDNCELIKCVLNLSTPSDTHWAHTHAGQIVLLYYVNLQWQHCWAGETLFFSEDYRDVIEAVTYIPGRLLLFDGDVPHSMRPQSINAPHYRFTLTMIFNKINEF